MKDKLRSLLPAGIIGIGLITLYSCGNEDENFMNQQQQSGIESKADEEIEKLNNELIQSIPSPLEMSSILKSENSVFNSQLLNDPNNLGRFKDKYEKATNLGMMVADLGYINIYEKNIYALSFLNGIKKLADDLKIGQFFDYETLKSLSSNSGNIDSLIYLSTKNFNEMDEYLRSQKRSELSVLLLTGAWIEGMHITTSMAEQSVGKSLHQRIGEQKESVTNILKILAANNSKPFFADLEKQLKEINQVYDGVKVEINYADPISKVVDGKMVVIDNSTTSITITDQQVSEIGKLVKNMRAQITKTN